MKRHSGKHKVLRALAAASGLGQLGARSGKVREFYAPKIRVNTKDLLKDPRKLAYLAVMNTAAELAASGGVSDNLTGAERSYIERSVSAFVGGKTLPTKPESVDMLVSEDDSGKLVLSTGQRSVKLAERAGRTGVSVCPHRLSETGNSGKVLAANHFAARVMFGLLGTGMGFKSRKVVGLKDGAYVEQYRYFMGPRGAAEPRLDVQPNRCYLVEVSKELQARAIENMAMNKMSKEYATVSSNIQSLVDSLSFGKKYLPGSDPSAQYAMNGLGEVEYGEGEWVEGDGALAGARRRRRKSAKRRVAKKAPSRRRSVRRKKK